MTEPERRSMFEAIVLQGIWVLILRSFGASGREQAWNFRSSAIHYMDEFGAQTDKSREYRRDVTYQNIPDSK